MKNSSIDSSDLAPAAEGSVALRRYLAILFTGLLAGLLAAEIALRVFIVPIIDSRANRVHRIYNAQNPDVVLGDSHLYRSFIRSNGFENLARPGSSPAALEIVAREYFRRLDPGRVILQASPQLLNAGMHLEGSQQHERWFRLNLGLPFVPYLLEPGISRELGALLDWPALRQRREVALGRTVLDGVHVQKEAVRRRALGHAELREAADIRLRQNRPIPDFESGASLAAWVRLLEYLVQRGARVCVLTTAVDEAYLKSAAQEPLHARAGAVFRELAATHGARFVDFRDLDLELDVADFTNADHLTTRAGGRFAARAQEACFSSP